MYFKHLVLSLVISFFLVWISSNLVVIYLELFINNFVEQSNPKENLTLSIQPEIQIWLVLQVRIMQD